MGIGPPRRMALVPLPAPGESFGSWMDAVARDNLCPRSTLLVKYWRLRKVPYAAAWRPTSSTDLAQISIATGVAEHALASLLIERYFDSGFPAPSLEEWWSDDLREFMRQEFVLHNHSRWCPLCIGDNGGRWMLRWKMAWSYACTTHKVFLAFRCLQCKSPQDSGIGLPTRRLVCPTPIDPKNVARRCGHPLTDVPVIPVTDRRLIELQAWIDHGLGDAPRPSNGPSAQPLFVFPVTVYLALRLRTPEMFTDADPAIATAAANPFDTADELTKFYGPGSGDAAHPLLMAGAISLADRFCRGKNRREATALFADLAYTELVTRTPKWMAYEPLSMPWRMRRYALPALLKHLVDRRVVQDTPAYGFHHRDRLTPHSRATEAIGEMLNNPLKF
ncbi:hypothetical protein EF906_01260 [Streptomyces sp. WAC08241]|nr:hypothetical protein EF906_01260 [Streptomyces sp. WAC08241]